MWKLYRENKYTIKAVCDKCGGTYRIDPDEESIEKFLINYPSCHYCNHMHHYLFKVVTKEEGKKK